MLQQKCCINELHELLIFSIKTFHEYNLRYSVDAGTAVGSIKLRSTLPWELDHDLTFKPEDFSVLVNLSSNFNHAGYTFKIELEDPCLTNHSINVFRCGYMGIKSKHWRMELYGSDTLAYEAYDNRTFHKRHGVQRIKGQKTLTRLGNFWASSKNNPGLYCRSHYGLDCLRHQRHWSEIGAKHGYHNYTTDSKWIDCVNPGFHSCFNNYMTDGNLQFLHKPWA